MPYCMETPCGPCRLTALIGHSFDDGEPHGPCQSEAGPGPERGLRCTDHQPGQEQGGQVDPEAHGQPYTRLVAHRVLTAMMGHESPSVLE